MRILYVFSLISLLGLTTEAQTISKVLNIQGVLKSVTTGTISGSYGMRFTFKKNGAAFATPCQITKNSVSVINSVFNATVDTSTCNLASEIPNSTAATITVDIEVDTSSATFTSAVATFSGITVNPVAMSLIAEKANGLTVTGTNGQILTYNGTNWIAGSSPVSVSSVSGRSGAITLTTADIGGLGSAAMLNTGAILQTSNNLSEIAASPAAARTNLGLGALAVISPSGTANSSTYLRGDGSWAAAPSAPVTTVAGRTGAVVLANTDISGLGTLAVISPTGTANSSTFLRGDGSWAAAPVTSVNGNTGTVIITAGSLGAALSGANSDITSLSGLTTALSIGQGGTGQTSATAAFNALSPLTTKGDLVVSSGSANVRLGAGSDGNILVSDSTSANGLKWTSPIGSVFAGNFGGALTGQVSTTLEFIMPGYSSTSSTSTTIASTTEVRRQMIVPTAGTIRDFFVYVTTASGAGTLTFTIRKNGANTGITISVPTTGVGAFSDTTNTVGVVAGDLISIGIVSSAGVAKLGPHSFRLVSP
jgi:hypothetical protein